MKTVSEGGNQSAAGGERIEVVAFDFGGVLVDVDLASLDLFARHFANSRAVFFAEDWHERLTVGACSAPDCIAAVAAALSADPKAVQEAWANVVSACDGAVALVQEVAQRRPVVVWSNTDPVHWGKLRAIFPMLDTPHAAISCELGAAKPAPLFYSRALSRLRAAAPSVLFLDNLEENVRAAQALGIQAACVQGVSEARHALKRFGALA